MTTPRPSTAESTRAELIELESVNVPKRGSTPPALLAIGMTGLLVLAAVGATQMTTSAKGTPTPPPAGALASPAPLSVAPAASPTRTARPTPSRTVVPVTPKPSNAHPWTWTRMDVELNLGVIPSENMWGLNNQVLLLGFSSDGFDRNRYEIASIDTGFGWVTYPVPNAIASLDGASVIHGHLWFVARVSGVSADQGTWQLVGTTTGETWESLGPIDGLNLDAESGTGVGFIGRVGDTWVISTFQNEGPSHLSWSNDGRHWEPATMPERDGQVEVYQPAIFQGRMLALGYAFSDYEHVQYFVLSTTDGQAWERSSIDVAPGRSLNSVTCNIDTCVVVEDPLEGEATTTHVWVTTDGDSWSRVSVDLPMVDPGSSLRLVRATDEGFIAMAGYSDTALLSVDGRTWKAVDAVKPAIAMETLANLAVARDLVVGFGQAASSDLPNALWRGSLISMGLAP